MPRALWKGHLRIDALACAVALYAAASTSDRVSFNTINRATGNRVRRIYVDQRTGAEVDRDAQVKGYETGKDRYVILEPEEIESAIPDGDKTLEIQAFLACSEIDTTYFDKPYYLAPADDAAREAFVLIRDGLRRREAAALARATLFRRVRGLLIRPDGDGLVANTLNFDYEVKPATEAFAPLADIAIKGEMLDLAKHIIETKRGAFDPTAFADRYDAALAELVKAKSEGRKFKQAKPASTAKVVDLMEALRQSAGGGAPTGKTRAKKPASAGTRRKAG